jgi:TonB-linked SusC/RagA family outer membrane protein
MALPPIIKFEHLMRKKLTLLFSLLFMGFSLAFAQTNVKGRVSDKAGQPLPGVTIKVVSGTVTTISDASGNYTIAAGPNANLTFSYVGFAPQTIAVNNQTTLNVTLTEENNNLNDVVVVGYGTQKKSVVTGAISQIKAKDIEDQQVLNINQALQGRTTGTTVVNSTGAPGSSAQIRIRGVNSIRNSDPLYVVDGIIMLNGGIENINPNDIESFEVLKDASAAIYGSRSSNGVILVTTKKGKIGAPTFSYNSYLGYQSPISRAKVTNASQYATLRNQAAANDGVALPFTNPTQYGEGTNWQDQIFSNNAMIQNHSISVQSGSENTSMYVSFAYLNQQGTIFKDISSYKRYNFVANTSTKVKKWLTIGENFSYIYTNSRNSFNTNSEFGGPLSSALNLDPITPVLFADSTAGTIYARNPVVRNSAGVPYAISPDVQQEISNPLAYLETQRGNYGWSHNISGNAFIEVSPLSGLKFRTQINGKQAFFGNQSFTPLYYLNSQNSNLSNPNAFRASNRNLTWNWDNTASYTKTVGLHSFSVLAGTSAFEESGVDVNATYNNIPVTTYEGLSFNYSLPQAQRVGGSGDAQPYHVFSYFARATYDYDQKYLFTGIIRRDGSSKFGSNNVYGTFPSAQLGWVVTRENFFPKNSFVDFLKLRGSYGTVGNEQTLDRFQYTPVIGSGYNSVFGNQLVIGNSPNTLANPDLKWESTSSADIGFDAILFKNLNVTFDLYKKVTSGLLRQPRLPAYLGLPNDPFFNVGNLENKGVELELTYTKKFGDLTANFGGNISYNENTVTNLGVQPTLDGGSFQNSSYPIFRSAAGQPVDSFFGFQTLGVFHSQAEADAYTSNGTKIQPNAKAGDLKFQDTNNNGSIDQGDRVFLGTQLPKFNYGLTFGANYKNFDFKVFGQGAWGNKIFQGYRRLDIQKANYPSAALDAWTPANASSNYPRLTYADPNQNYSNPSNFYLQSGAYFRVKTLQVGYSIPANILSKMDIKRARIYLSSNNLATITKYNGFDPEIVGGIDRGIYPQSRSFLLGFDITL